MNLLTYYEKEETTLFEQIDTQYHPLFKRTIASLKQAALPQFARARFLSELTSKGRTHTLDEKETDSACARFIQEERAKLSLWKRLVLAYSDLPIILFFYAGVYEVALDHLLEPLLNQTPVHWMFPLTLSLIVNTLILYLIAKVLMVLLARASSTVSLYYWLVVLGCFLAFLGLTYLSRTYLDQPLLQAPTLAVIALTAACAWGSLMLFRRYNGIAGD